MSNYEALELINSVFSVNLNETDYSSKISEKLQWDSYMIVSLLAEIMDKYNIKLSGSELFEVTTIGELVNIIQTKVNSR